jgi:hypothetical protein
LHTVDHRIPKADARMNTAIRKLPQGLGAGFAESMPAQNAKHIDLMRLLDSQVDEHLGWSTDESPVPSRPGAADPHPDPHPAPDPPVEPVRNDDSNPAPAEWHDTVLDPSSAIDVAFTEHDVAPASTPVPAPPARFAWTLPLMKATLPLLVLFFASIPVTVWLTLQWSNPAPGAATAVVEKPQAEPATKPAQTPTTAAPQATAVPAQPAASAVPVVAAAQSSPATGLTDVPVVHESGAVAEAAPSPAQPAARPATTRPRPIDNAACAESRAALGLCGSTPHGPSTTSPGVKP